MAPKHPRGDTDTEKTNPKTDYIEELPAPIVSDKPAPQLETPQGVAVGALFRTDADMRRAITHPKLETASR